MDESESRTGALGSLDALAQMRKGPLATEQVDHLEEARSGGPAGQGHPNRLGQLPHLETFLVQHVLEGLFERGV